tara:strand:+ start:282 stop:569 length:288 start_codon:yes stop_codon:yes gene_type:complete
LGLFLIRTEVPTPSSPKTFTTTEFYVIIIIITELEPLFLLLGKKLMSFIKDELLQRQEEEQDLWETYLLWVEDNRDLFQQLPKNIQDIVENYYGS